MAKQSVLMAIAAALLAAPASAGGFKGLARELTGAARGASIKRVAVVPFVPSDGGSSKEGWGISERLVTQIVRSGQVHAVERNLLSKVMEEHYLEATGAIDGRGLQRIGRVLSVDGIVAGSFVRRGSQVLVSARLIDARTGAIIGAAEQKVERDFLAAPVPRSGAAPSDDPWGRDAPLRGSVWDAPAPEFTVEPPRFGSEPDLLRDSPSPSEPGGCRGAAERVDAMEKEILDLKARYWAGKLREGLAASSVKHNPGSTITDPLLKKEFYQRLRDWHAQPGIPALTPAEARRFAAIDGAAFALHQECGI